MIPPAVSKRRGTRHKRNNCPRQTAHTNFREWQSPTAIITFCFASLNSKPTQPMCRAATELSETNHWQPLYVTQSPDNISSWSNETVVVCLTRLPSSATQYIDENFACRKLAWAFITLRSRLLSMKTNVLHTTCISGTVSRLCRFCLNPCVVLVTATWRTTGVLRL